MKKKERKEEGTREIRRAAKAAKSRGGRPKRCFRGCLSPGLRAAAAVGAGRAAVTLAAEGVTDAAGTGHGPVSGAGRSEASSHLPVAEPGYRLCPGPASPSSTAPCSAMASTTARSPSGGLQLMAAEALAATPVYMPPLIAQYVDMFHCVHLGSNHTPDRL